MVYVCILLLKTPTSYYTLLFSTHKQNICSPLQIRQSFSCSKVKYKLYNFQWPDGQHSLSLHLSDKTKVGPGLLKGHTIIREQFKSVARLIGICKHMSVTKQHKIPEGPIVTKLKQQNGSKTGYYTPANTRNYQKNHLTRALQRNATACLLNTSKMMHILC